VQTGQSFIVRTVKFYFKFMFDSIKPDFQYGYGHGGAKARKHILYFYLKVPFSDLPWPYHPSDVIGGVNSHFETQLRTPNRILIEIWLSLQCESSHRILELSILQSSK
jgi:hypothetical protein